MAKEQKLEPKVDNEILRNFEGYLDTISTTFCAAKWLQSTIHLGIGFTHSCHHPTPHKIPIEELENNPLAIHNTYHKKLARKAMLKGEVVPECHYCNMVDRETDISDRVMKSYSPWAQKHIIEIINSNWDAEILPSYLEISFGNQCNLKCCYCSPPTSSRWAAEARKYDGYPTSSNTNSWYAYNRRRPIVKDNPFIKAFWKIWPDMYQKLEHFRITGGEPLINKNTFKVFDYISRHPNENLYFSVNSNLSVPDKTMDEFIRRANSITDKVYRFKVFTSGDGYKEKLDYSRFGLKYDKWIKNIRRCLAEIPDSAGLTVIATYNILSVTSFTDFLKDMLELKLQYKNRFLIDIPLLITPEFLSPTILTEDYLKLTKDSSDFMYQNLEGPKNPYLGFYEFEAGKMSRIYHIFKRALEEYSEEYLTNLQKDFYLFFTEYDRRRETNFLNNFPEMKDYWELCKSLI